MSTVFLDTSGLYALLTRRVGLPAVERFREDFAPLLERVWIDGFLHERGLDLLLERGKTRLSLVDAVSFEVMSDSGVERAFDADFEDEGFELLRRAGGRAGDQTSTAGDGASGRSRTGWFGRVSKMEGPDSDDPMGGPCRAGSAVSGRL